MKKNNVDEAIEYIVSVFKHKDNRLLFLNLNNQQEKEKHIELAKKRALAETAGLVDCWFIANESGLQNIEYFKDTIRETAICEWGIGTEVIFESNEKVIVKNGDKEMVILKQGGNENG